VATYNIAGGRLGLGRVERTLRSLRADLLGLQEVWQAPRKGPRGDQAAFLAGSLGLRHAWGAHPMGKTPVEGLALLSRYPLSGVAMVPTPPGRRVFLKAVAHTPRGRLTVLVVHLRAVGLKTGARRAKYIAQRRAEARLVSAYAARMKGPLLLMGDLNDKPGSDTLGRLVPPLADACAGLTEKTWPSGLPLMRLDHLLLGAPLRSHGCLVVPSTASDHLPLVTEISW
jgi:endonuclease/exonuclease/phosphatase family metal-dependent hydrolase